jgi:hypothetical protein
MWDQKTMMWGVEPHQVPAGTYNLAASFSGYTNAVLYDNHKVTISPIVHEYDDGRTICGQSIESVKENAPFTLLLPTKLPEGYSLQSVDYVPDVYVNMQFFTRSLCDPANPYSPEEGVIEIVEASFSKESDAQTGEEYVQREMAKLQASNINATSYVFHDGRMHAIGYWDETYLKARLVVVDNKTGTIVAINARSLDTTLEQLALIAESLKEW